MKTLSRVLLILMMTNLIASCEHLVCGEYYEKFDDDSFKKELMSWSDTQIFSQTLDQGDFTLGHLVGPGDLRSTISKQSKKIEIPKWLEGYEIRVLDKDKFSPEGIFFGRKNYQGFLVTKHSIDSYKDGNAMKIGKLSRQENRLGVVCLSHWIN